MTAADAARRTAPAARAVMALLACTAGPVKADDVSRELPSQEDGFPRLSFGANLRLRQDVTSQPFFGLRGVPYEDFTTLRALGHAEARFSTAASAFLELGSMWAFGRSLPERSVDEDRLDVQQAFAELIPYDGPGPSEPSRVTLRAGRQALALGSSRLVGVRDGTNVRRAFDGARLMLESGTLEAQLIALASPAIERGVFDDAPSLDELLFGGYATLSLATPLSLDLYYLGYRNVESSWLDATGRELRHSFGLRAFGRIDAFDYNNEAVFQLGSAGGADILAWTVATDHGLTPFAMPDLTVRVAVRADLASGDGEPDDGKLGTFSPLFPKLPYFSELTLISPSNLIDLHPLASAELFDRATVQLDVDLFWRHRTRDAIYTSPNAPLVSPAGRFSGTQLNAQIELRATRELVVTFYGSYFGASRSLAAAGARDVSYFGFWLECTF